MDALKGYILKKYKSLRANNLDSLEADDEAVVDFVYALMMRKRVEIDHLKKENESLDQVAHFSSELIECYENFLGKVLAEHKDIDNSELLKAVELIDVPTPE